MPSVYLCGPIHGQSDEQCNGWRADATRLLQSSWSIIDPMRRDWRGLELMHTPEIVHLDKRDIDGADAMLVNATKPGWGTAMEMIYAFERRKLVVAFTDLSSRSPWVVMHAHFVTPKLVEACEFLNLGRVG